MGGKVGMKFLIYGGPGIGDMVIVMPMAEALKQHDKNCEVDLLICSNKEKIKTNLLMLQYQKYIDHIYYYAKSEIWHDSLLIRHIRKKCFQYCFVCQYHNNTSSVWPSRIVRAAGCKSVGVKPNNKRIKYDYIVASQETHISDYCFSLLQILGIKKRNKKTEYFNSLKLEKEAAQLEIDWNSKQYIALCVGTGMVSLKIGHQILTNDPKSWDLQNWLQLGAMLLKDQFGVIFLGGPHEKKIIERFADDIPKGAINLIGKTNIGESLAVLYKSTMVVGGDTGLMHCAGALNRKTVSLFGCTDPREYQPTGNAIHESIFLNCKCSPCFGTENSVLCKENICMKHIAVDEVHQKILSCI